MRKLFLKVCGISILLGAAFSAPVHAQSTGSPGATDASRDREMSKAMTALLRKYPNGGHAPIPAIEHLVATNPGAIAVPIAAAVEANAEQKTSIEQGIVQATALLGQSDPTSAKKIQAYLQANKSNAVVADILAAERSLGSGGNSPKSADGAGFAANAGDPASRN